MINAQPLFFWIGFMIITGGQWKYIFFLEGGQKHEIQLTMSLPLEVSGVHTKWKQQQQQQQQQQPANTHIYVKNKKNKKWLIVVKHEEK